MEKIKQALELAKQARQESGMGNVLKERELSSSSINDGVVPDSETHPITYSKTRIVKPDQNKMIENRVLFGTDDPAVNTAYRMLRTQVLQKLIANDWNSLAITSPGANQGKTLTAVNLAISLAREVNYTVLLVDFDLKKPGVHDCLGINVETGISDFILHDIPLDKTLINPGIERLVILPGRESLGNSSEMLKSTKMRQLVEELKTRYPSRLIIYDLPPLLLADDALAFSPYVESLLLVVEESITTKDELEQSLRLLKDMNIIGTVLNKSSDITNAAY